MLAKFLSPRFIHTCPPFRKPAGLQTLYRPHRDRRIAPERSYHLVCLNHGSFVSHSVATVKLDEERNLTAMGKGSFRVFEKEGSPMV